MTRPVRHDIVLSFESPQTALQWFDDARDAGAFPADYELFVADPLDTSAGRYLIRRHDDRPHEYSLRHRIRCSRRGVACPGDPNTP
ncbi:hypothetical protein [Embleya sp. MST-111070]|uniref:hypothetical protein n=1 Tax=Embleya sp. MST-111070 TaxID=3398231 RepID=UPI003F731603